LILPRAFSATLNISKPARRMPCVRISKPTSHSPILYCLKHILAMHIQALVIIYKETNLARPLGQKLPVMASWTTCSTHPALHYKGLLSTRSALRPIFLQTQAYLATIVEPLPDATCSCCACTLAKAPHQVSTANGISQI
jgi:hypothetical protein